MKVRSGFVSNSSSSSFIVGFKGKPQNPEDVARQLGLDPCGHIIYWDESFPVRALVDRIFHDLGEPIQDLESALAGYMDDGSPRCPEAHSGDDIKQRYRQWETLLNEYRKGVAGKISEKAKQEDLTLFQLHYSDNNMSALEAALEHSEVLDGAPLCITINLH